MIVTVALSTLLLMFQSCSLQVTFATFVMLVPSWMARAVIVIVALVPFSMDPIFQMNSRVAFLYVQLLPVAFMNSKFSGIVSFSVTLVALVPFHALWTVMFHVTMSSMKTVSCSAVLFTDTSTIGSGVIVSFTVLFVPFGPIIVMLLVRLPSALTFALTTIVTLELAEIFVKIQVILLSPLVSLTRTAFPIICTGSSVNSNPSGKVSITVRLLV